MKRRRHRLLMLLSGCMALCWISAWGGFLARTLFNRSFPFPEATLLFFAGTWLAAVSRGRGWRVLTVLVIHAGGLLFGALGALHHFFSRSASPYGFQWLKGLFESSPGFMEWISILFVLFCMGIIYVRGARLGTKPMDHLALCTRFDLGIAAFFVLFFVHLVMVSKGATVMGDPAAHRLVIPFFLFSLLGIGLARNGTVAGRSAGSESSLLGTIVGFFFVVLLFGTGLILFFLPQLTRAAEIGYKGLKIVSAPLAPVLVGIIRFLFDPRRFLTGNNGSTHTVTDAGPVAPPDVQTWWIAKIAAWFFAAVLMLTVVAVLLVCLWFLYRWLLSRTPGGRRVQWDSDPVLTWLRRKWRLLVSVVQATVRFFHPRKSAAEIYVSLQKWGRKIGLKRLPQETAMEYGRRMTMVLPRLEQEFAVIIDAFNEEIYGETRLDAIRLARTRKALRKLRNPALWLARMKLLFVSPASRQHPGCRGD